MRNGKINKMVLVGVVIIAMFVIILVVNGNKKVNTGTNNTTNTTENTQVNTNGEKINTSTKLKEARDVDSLYVDKIELKNVSDRTTFTANITNKGTEATKGQLYNIVFLDKAGNSQGTMGLYIRSIKPNETISVEASIDKDVTECYDFNLQLK